MLIPPPLPENGHIRFIAPSNPLFRSEEPDLRYDRAQEWLQSQGFTVSRGKNVEEVD